MFNHYEPNVKLLITFLNLLKIKVNSTTVNETLQNHPEYPSFLCFSDSLNKWNIPNAAYKVEQDYIDTIATPFLAYTNELESNISIITEITNDSIKSISGSNNKVISESRESFFRKWKGICLVTEPSEESGEKEYSKHKLDAFLKMILPILLVVILTVLSFSFLIKCIVNSGSNDSLSAVGICLQYLILWAGTIVTIALLWYEIDKTNPFLQKVCTGMTKGNCNSILTGKRSKVFSWLSWSEVGFFYFTGGLLSILFLVNSIKGGITVIAFLNLVALPYTVFSIYYQWRIAKQWCVLCLAVQALLVLGAINILVNNLLQPISGNESLIIIETFFLYLLPLMVWFSIKPYILQLQEMKHTKREYLRIKFNEEIFETLLKKQKIITVPFDGLGIDLGNPNASNTLIKVCSPYCGPCAKAHPKMEKLIEENTNIKAKIIFATQNSPELQSYKPAVHLLAIAEQKNDSKIKKALDDWYLAEKKDYDTFAVKYPMKSELTQQGNKIDAMDKWCRAMEITSTPTFFINGHKIPDAYGIEDLKYFLAE